MSGGASAQAHGVSNAKEKDAGRGGKEKEKKSVFNRLSIGYPRLPGIIKKVDSGVDSSHNNSTNHSNAHSNVHGNSSSVNATDASSSSSSAVNNNTESNNSDTNQQQQQ